MEWSLISLIIGFDPIYSKMNHLKRVQGVLKMIFQKDSKISRIRKISEFCQKLPIYQNLSNFYNDWNFWDIPGFWQNLYFRCSRRLYRTFYFWHIHVVDIRTNLSQINLKFYLHLHAFLSILEPEKWHFSLENCLKNIKIFVWTSDLRYYHRKRAVISFQLSLDLIFSKILFWFL